MQPSLLPDMAVLRLTGTDRHEFLQGQLTQDITAASESHSLLWGWNNPKGRLLATGQLVQQPDATLLVMPAELAAASIARLRLFVLRADVQVETADLAVAGIEAGTDSFSYEGLTLDAAAMASVSDGERSLARVAGDPARALLLAPAGKLTAASNTGLASGWELADIRAGLPTVTGATAEAFVPQMLNLDLLDGISFSKGCYVGQEVVARTQNLGRIKRRMFRYASPMALEPGASLRDADDSQAGQVVRCASAGSGYELLAVVQLSATGGQLYGEGQALEQLPLPYPIPGNDPATA